MTCPKCNSFSVKSLKVTTKQMKELFEKQYIKPMECVCGHVFNGHPDVVESK